MNQTTGGFLAARLAASLPRDRIKWLKEFLLEKIGEALGIEPWQVGTRDNLMDLGVDSMKAVELKMMVGRELDLSLSSSLLFDYPNVEALAEFLLEQANLELKEQPTIQLSTPHPMREEFLVASNGHGPAEDLSVESVAVLLEAELEDLGLRNGGDMNDR